MKTIKITDNSRGIPTADILVCLLPVTSCIFCCHAFRETKPTNSCWRVLYLVLYPCSGHRWLEKRWLSDTGATNYRLACYLCYLWGFQLEISTQDDQLNQPHLCLRSMDLRPIQRQSTVVAGTAEVEMEYNRMCTKVKH